MFTVIIPTYNRPALLKRALQSVRVITPQQVPAIVVDDCSSAADAEAIANAYGAKYIRLTENSGPGVARQAGLAAAVTRWAILLDDDDELRPDSISIAAQAISSFRKSEEFPCVQFARPGAALDVPFKVAGLDDYLHHRIKGDFSSVIQVQTFLSAGLSFPPLRVGGEHLLWYRIAKEFGIPTWTTEIAKSGNDAPTRLCSVQSQLRRPSEYACLAERTLDVFGKEIRAIAPARYRDLLLGAAAYRLLAGERKRALRHIWRLALTGKIVHASAAAAMALLPGAGVASAFRRYRKRQMYASPASN